MRIIVFVILLSMCIAQQDVLAQRMTHNNDYTSLYILDAQRNRGFEVSVSMVAMFTAGCPIRNGIRLGGGMSVGKSIGDWKMSVGFDAYKATERFGIGTTFAGIEYYDGRYGGSYFLNKYHQGDKQVSGIVGVNLDDFHIRFEDDILSLPFTGFTIYDRYRTAALEIRYRHFIVGMNVYTNEANGLTDISTKNKRGTYLSGKQLSSPIYVGYTDKNLMVRYGLNNRNGGYWGQNGWHRKLFDTGDFNTGEYRSHFLQIGVDKPYTLY